MEWGEVLIPLTGFPVACTLQMGLTLLPSPALGGRHPCPILGAPQPGSGPPALGKAPSAVPSPSEPVFVHQQRKKHLYSIKCRVIIFSFWMMRLKAH